MTKQQLIELVKFAAGEMVAPKLNDEDAASIVDEFVDEEKLNIRDFCVGFNSIDHGHWAYEKSVKVVGFLMNEFAQVNPVDAIYGERVSFEIYRVFEEFDSPDIKVLVEINRGEGLVYLYGLRRPIVFKFD